MTATVQNDLKLVRELIARELGVHDLDDEHPEALWQDRFVNGIEADNGHLDMRTLDDLGPDEVDDFIEYHAKRNAERARRDKLVAAYRRIYYQLTKEEVG